MDEQGRHPYSRGELARLVLRRAVTEFNDDRCSQFAAAIAYHVIFALFPLTIVLAAVFGLVVRTAGAQADVIDAIIRALPLSASGAGSIRTLLRGATSDTSTLGLVGGVGIVYAASGMMAALRNAINAAFDVRQARPFLKGKLVDVSLVAVAAVVGLGSLALNIAVRVLGDRAPAPLGGAWVPVAAGLGLPLLLAFLVAFGLYRFVSAADVQTRYAWPVALGAACAFVVLQNAFAIYARHFASYNAVYGSLGAVIAFMVFTYVGAMLLLFGVEVLSEWPRAERTLARGHVGDPTPLRAQVRQALRGLWLREREREDRQTDEAEDGDGDADGPAR